MSLCEAVEQSSGNFAMSSNSYVRIPVGFRFHPTDEELVGHYLYGKVGRAQRDQLIQELDLNKFEPWDLHRVCRIGDVTTEDQSDWYFFSHKDKKYPCGNRANRATADGSWKATGRDKPIHSQCNMIGMRKTLVFYRGRAPNGQKTDWIMHEFRLDGGPGVVPNYGSDGWVVCRVFRKTKNINAKSQDTYCTFQECQQVESGLLPPEVMSPRNQEKYLNGGVGAISITSQLHHHFSFTCKQEISVEDHRTTVHNSFMKNLHHLPRPHEAGTDHSLAPCSSIDVMEPTSGVPNQCKKWWNTLQCSGVSWMRLIPYGPPRCRIQRRSGWVIVQLTHSSHVAERRLLDI